METEYGKSFTNVVLWSDGMGTQFRVSHCPGSTMRDTMTKAQ